jgi:hypothetical protein
MLREKKRKEQTPPPPHPVSTRCPGLQPYVATISASSGTPLRAAPLTAAIEASQQVDDELVAELADEWRRKEAENARGRRR